MQYTQKELDKILELHLKWLANEKGGIGADLRSADLSSADLRFANLSFANLSSANLSSADLRFAYLSSADLIYFTYNKHTAYFVFDNMIRIGCHHKSIKEWVKIYKSLGINESYSKLEIMAYGNFIKLCAKLQKEKDKEKSK